MSAKVSATATRVGIQWIGLSYSILSLVGYWGGSVTVGYTPKEEEVKNDATS